MGDVTSRPMVCVELVKNGDDRAVPVAGSSVLPVFDPDSSKVRLVVYSVVGTKSYKSIGFSKSTYIFSVVEDGDDVQ